MTTQEFISKWHSSINHLGLPTIGIRVGWDIIPADSKVKTISGKDAWNTILESTPPWFKKPQTFNQLRESKNSDYLQIIKEETENGKIEYYRTKGLQEPHFCIFANNQGDFMLLVDGNHRFLNCIYLQSNEKISFDSGMVATTLDIIYLPNFDDVIRPDLIWKENWK